LFSQGALDEAMQDIFLPSYRSSKQSSLYRFTWRNNDDLDFVITNFHPAFYHLPACDHFKSINWIYTDPKVLLKVLTCNSLVPPTLFIAQIRDRPQSSLHEFARLYFQKYLSSDNYADPMDKNCFNSWRELAKWMFVGVSHRDLCRVGHNPWEYVTPLFAGLLGCDPTLSRSPLKPLHARRRLLMAMNAWLQDLHVAGVDLQTHGENEWNLYRKDDWLRAWHWNNLVSSHGNLESGEESPQLLSFTYGSRPEDWGFQWEFAIGEYAGHFWAMLDAQLVRPTRMPGGWEDD
jgi:hypothetical protein